jgi:cellulose synthase/poly-beta-1,6-N-acetylglucosamine synthase-like glycosyltransferase
MIFLVYLAALIIAIYIAIQLVVLVSFLQHNEQEKTLKDDELPFISILIAARNEERNILYCLTSLCGLNYPKDKYEILVGNDGSEDHTEHFVRDFIKEKSSFALYNITEEVGLAKGKANVLAQLARKAKGEYLLITDADTEVQPDWPRTLVSQADEKTGIVSGVTVVRSGGLIDDMQQTDWLSFMAHMQGFENLGKSATAVGNNMLVSRKAYDETGGYENIPFSVTEDYKLFQYIRELGWKTKNVALSACVNYSRGLGTFNKVIRQRLRWLTGARELPAFWWFIFTVYALFWPAVTVVALHNWVLALQLIGIKVVLQWLYLILFGLRLKLTGISFRIPEYEVYSILITAACTLAFLMRRPVNWKGRKYS